jgi:hypothetical protein
MNSEHFRRSKSACSKNQETKQPKKRDRSKSAARYRPAKEGEKRRGTRVAGGSRRVGMRLSALHGDTPYLTCPSFYSPSSPRVHVHNANTLIGERFRTEATASLPGIIEAPSPEAIFEGMEFQRLRLHHDQQVPEWERIAGTVSDRIPVFWSQKKRPGNASSYQAKVIS